MTDDKNAITCTRTQCSARLASTDIRPTSVYARTGLLVPVLHPTAITTPVLQRSPERGGSTAAAAAADCSIAYFQIGRFSK